MDDQCKHEIKLHDGYWLSCALPRGHEGPHSVTCVGTAWHETTEYDVTVSWSVTMEKKE